MLATLASLTLAVVVQDQTPLRAAPSNTATTHAQLLQGDVLEVRGQRLDHVQVWDHRRERAGYVRAAQLRTLPSNEADAAQAQAVWRFLRDAPGQETLGIAYVAAYLKAAPARSVSAEPFEALGVMAERLAQRASQAPSPRQFAAAAHLEVVAPYGVKFQSWEHEGVARLCYEGEAFRQVLAMPATADQKAVAALALTRHDCINPAINPQVQAQRDAERAEVLDTIDTATPAQLDAGLKNKLRLRRAGVWSTVAYQRARAALAPQAAAQRAINELAAVDKQQLSDDDQAAFQDAALRVGAVRFAALPAATLAGRVQLRTEPGEPGQTCVRVVEVSAKEEKPLVRRCTYGVVWPASARVSADGRALVLAVQPTATWTELWLFKADVAAQSWVVNVLPPAAVNPGVGYAEWAGFVPGQAKMLVAREALSEAGKAVRRFEVLSTDSLTPERWASTPELLGSFRWQDPQWKRHTVALR
jgi:hypothetical protein